MVLSEPKAGSHVLCGALFGRYGSIRGEKYLNNAANRLLTPQ
jgi:hypothetical protein